MAEKQRILIVDDDENIAELISLYLLKECYKIQLEEWKKCNSSGINLLENLL